MICKMIRVVCISFLSAVYGMPLAAQESPAEEDLAETIQLTNSAIRIVIERRGGQFVDLQLNESSVNPLSWCLTAETMPALAHTNALFKGHFLCMGRVGNPSPGEIKAGIPMRGEQTGRLWNVTKSDGRVIQMDCAAPMDGLNVRRRVELGDTDTVFFVNEWFENTGSLGRLNNVLQHVTIGPPFLSKETRINSNARQGFNHKFAYPDPHVFESDFPIARLVEAGDETTDLRLSSDPVNYLSKHIFSPADTYGWVTAYDPVSGLVLGYVWKTRDYPWLNLWQQVKDGKPVAKGLEFGTVGMPGTYQQLLEYDTRFHGIPSWEYLDAGEQVEKSYLAFLIDIGPNQENPVLVIEKDRLLLNGHIQIRNPFVANL